MDSTLVFQVFFPHVGNAVLTKLISLPCNTSCVRLPRLPEQLHFRGSALALFCDEGSLQLRLRVGQEVLHDVASCFCDLPNHLSVVVYLGRPLKAYIFGPIFCGGAILGQAGLFWSYFRPFQPSINQ